MNAGRNTWAASTKCWNAIQIIFAKILSLQFYPLYGNQEYRKFLLKSVGRKFVKTTSRLWWTDLSTVRIAYDRKIWWGPKLNQYLVFLKTFGIATCDKVVTSTCSKLTIHTHSDLTCIGQVKVDRRKYLNLQWPSSHKGEPKSPNYKCSASSLIFLMWAKMSWMFTWSWSAWRRGVVWRLARPRTRVWSLVFPALRCIQDGKI